MFCYVCAEPLKSGEKYCRGCGTAAFPAIASRASWLSTIGHFALGILAFGLFTILFVFFSGPDFLRMAPYARYFFIAIAGGLSLGFSIHLYSKRREQISLENREKLLERSHLDLLPEPAPTSFLSLSDELNVPTTSKLKVPR
jgi:hypothetical protein